MGKPMRIDFNRRFRRRVLLPGGLILIATALVCGVMLLGAGQNIDSLSVMAQQIEVRKASTQGMDELSLAQESIALCEQCIKEARADSPDLAWLEENVAAPLHELYRASETYIVDGEGRPLLSFVDGERRATEAFGRIAPAANRFIRLARGVSQRTTGRSNLNERLPGSPPAPLTFPAVAGLTDGPTTVQPTVRTSDSTRHATDLVRIGDRIAFISAMQLARYDKGEGESGANPQAPVIVSLRYLDDAFLARAERENYLYDGRITFTSEGAENEALAPLTDSEGNQLATFAWKPELGSSLLIRNMLWPVGGAFAVICLLLLLMALQMRRLMKHDDENLSRLEEAHVELTAKEAQAHHLAYHDTLTGLPNRAQFNECVDLALSRARTGPPLAILLLDLDRFKNVNDRFGHLVGDELIREVGKRLARLETKKHMVARLGGDEFAILVEREGPEDMLEDLLQRIIRDIRQPYELLGNKAHIGVSIGVAMSPEYGRDRTELMRKADIALYRAKEGGRNDFRYFDKSMDETVQSRASLEQELRAALQTRTGLSVHYQPLVNSRSGQIEGFEALMLWDHAERGPVPPQQFIPIAEETGLIMALGEFVLDDARRVARQWPGRTIAINLYPLQFQDESFAGRICKMVQDAGVDASQIELEVTESVVLDRSDTVRDALRQLRQVGFRIALDDFGTGYSSLSNLRNFEVDRNKIDKSFVSGLGKSAEASAITSAVITLGHAMGLQVTAEGIETEEQQILLRSAGCNALQGYLFSKAVPASELQDSINDYRRQTAA